MFTCTGINTGMWRVFLVHFLEQKQRKLTKQVFFFLWPVRIVVSTQDLYGVIFRKKSVTITVMVANKL